jgi:predicted TIM-barrel fold metal-dependent hydrolase
MIPYPLNILFTFVLFVAFVSGCGSRQSIPIVDTHIHLYDTTRSEGVPWPPESDKILYRPVLPPDFAKVCQENDITATVIVEASTRLADNQWVLDLVKDEPERYIALVGSLQVGSSDFAANLEKLSADPRFVGIRMRERPRGAGYFNDEVWRDLELLADKGQTLDVLMFEFSLEDVDQVARRIPALKILINHVAGANIDGKPVDSVWARQLAQAASNPNVYCKVSGLFQQSHLQPSPVDLTFYKPVLDELWKLFGEDRLIYGSNWPVTMRGGSYASYKAVVMEFLEPKGRKSMKKILADNAYKFYGLK